MPRRVRDLRYQHTAGGYTFDYDDGKSSGELWAYNVSGSVEGERPQPHAAPP
jgi:hypothetical protein